MKKILLFLLFFNMLFASVTKEDVRKIIKEENMLLIHYIDKRFEAVDKRFDVVDKRFEAVDKKFEEMQKRTDKRFEEIDKKFEEMQHQIDNRFNDLTNFLYILTGIFTSLTLGVIGFAYWDRRTIIRKAKEETIEEIEKEGKVIDLIRALKELSQKDRELALILRNYGFL